MQTYSLGQWNQRMQCQSQFGVLQEEEGPSRPVQILDLLNAQSQVAKDAILRTVPVTEGPINQIAPLPRLSGFLKL